MVLDAQTILPLVETNSEKIIKLIECHANIQQDATVGRVRKHRRHQRRYLDGILAIVCFTCFPNVEN